MKAAYTFGLNTGVCSKGHSCNLNTHPFIKLSNSSFSLFKSSEILIMSPPDRVGRHIVFPHASVRLSVCPSQIVSTLNLKTVKDFSMKLGTLVNHDEMMCHAQEP